MTRHILDLLSPRGDISCDIWYNRNMWFIICLFDLNFDPPWSMDKNSWILWKQWLWFDVNLCFNYICLLQWQGGRTWQPFVGSKNGNENFRQARIYNFRVKCVVFAHNRKFAKLPQDGRTEQLVEPWVMFDLLVFMWITLQVTMHILCGTASGRCSRSFLWYDLILSLFNDTFSYVHILES